MKYSWSVFDKRTLQSSTPIFKKYYKSLLCAALIYEATECAASVFLMQSKSVFIDNIAARDVS